MENEKEALKARTERNKPIMEQIWNAVPKEHNLPPPFKGDHIRYIATDPKFLYLTGFVDEKLFTLEQWEGAFQDCKQPNNTYLISKDKFLSLGQYKYTGPVKKPLEPMKIREGWYDVDAWHEFCVKSIMPSTTLSIEHLVQAEKLMKEAGQIVNRRILIDKAAKLRMKKVLDDFPSPSRRRELSIEDHHQKRVEAEVARSKAPASAQTTFAKGEKLGDRDKRSLKETLLKTAKIAKTTKEEAPTLSLKDIRKKSKTKKQTL